MKVIAKTENGYLVDCTDDELATCQGISRVDKRFTYPKPGDTIDISEIYDIVARLGSSYIFEELVRNAKELTRLADWFSTYKEKYKDVTKPITYQER